MCHEARACFPTTPCPGHGHTPHGHRRPSSARRRDSCGQLSTSAAGPWGEPCAGHRGGPRGPLAGPRLPEAGREGGCPPPGHGVEPLKRVPYGAQAQQRAPVTHHWGEQARLNFSAKQNLLHFGTRPCNGVRSAALRFPTSPGSQAPRLCLAVADEPPCSPQTQRVAKAVSPWPVQPRPPPNGDSGGPRERAGGLVYSASGLQDGGRVESPHQESSGAAPSCGQSIRWQGLVLRPELVSHLHRGGAGGSCSLVSWLCDLGRITQPL